MSSSDADTRYWDARRGRVFSRRGGWIMGRGVYAAGYEMMDDLVGHASYFQVLMLNILGEKPERRLAQWLEAAHICLSWPDPRIWCNQVGAFGGTMHASPVASTVAGVLAADSNMYGTRPLRQGVEFIQGALGRQRAGADAETIVADALARSRGKVNIMGYARPIASGDERVEAMERVGRDLGYEDGPHLRLAYAIEAVLRRSHGESMNINGYMSAFLSDRGLTGQQVYEICAMLVMSGVTACHLDTAERPHDSLLPLRCEDIDYTGPAPRPVPPRRNADE